MEILKWYNYIIFYKVLKMYNAKIYHFINETAMTRCLKINHEFSTIKTIKS